MRFSIIRSPVCFRTLRIFLMEWRLNRAILVLLLMWATGCAPLTTMLMTGQKNPETAKAGCGYVDFYAPSTSAIRFWTIQWPEKSTILGGSSGYTTNFYGSGSAYYGPLKNCVRFESLPGRKTFKITAAMKSEGEKYRVNGGVSEQDIQVDAQDGMVTPVAVKFQRVASTIRIKVIDSASVHIAVGVERYENQTFLPGTKVRTTRFHFENVPATALDISATVAKPMPYRKKDAMPYFTK